MTIKTVWAVYFSGTGTTEKVVTAVAKDMANALGAEYDSFSFNLPKSREGELTFGPDGIQPGSYQDTLGNAIRLAQQGGPCPRVFHACGSEDPRLPAALETRDFFRRIPGNPFDYQFVEAPGGHDWEFWDTHIRDFIQYLQLPVVKAEYL